MALTRLTLTLVALHMGVASAATVTGKLSYPSEELPAMEVIARNVATGEQVRIETRASQSRYRMEVPAGVWVFFAAPVGEGPPPKGQPPLFGAHTEYSVCARDRQKLEMGLCRTGPLLELSLGSQRIERVDIDDWYLSADQAWLLARGAHPSRQPDNYADAELRFEAYPVATARFTPKPPDFTRAADVVRQVRSEIEAAASMGPDFAQEVVLARWNCGKACESWALVDLASGTIVWPEEPWRTLRTDFPCKIQPLDYRLDSRLLRLHRMDGSNIRTQTYLWSNEDQQLKPFVEGVEDAGKFCAANSQRKGE